MASAGAAVPAVWGFRKMVLNKPRLLREASSRSRMRTPRRGGEAPAKKRTAAEEYSDFMAGVAADVAAVERREESEAAAAAAERAAREAFEQECGPA